MSWLARRIKSFAFALNGWSLALNETNFKIHLIAAVFALVGGFWLKIYSYEWIAILFCIGAVISLELINTAIEKLADRVTTEQDELIGKVKDLAAGAVLFSSLISVIVAIVIVFNHL